MLVGIICAGALLAEIAGGIRFSPPAAWKSQGDRPMRAATYAAPAAEGDREPAELAVYYFGAGQGGGVEDNLKRWTSQFQNAGKPNIRKQTIRGLSVTTIDLSGTYVAASGPMMAKKETKPGYRLLGAIVEGPKGPVFFKFTGPEKTVAAHQGNFQALIKSISK
jgi:hypothetical protein